MVELPRKTEHTSAPDMIGNRIPFRIRGHHLGQFSILLRYHRANPEKWAKLSSEAHKYKRRNGISTQKRSDATDVIGYTDLGTRRYQNNLTSLYHEFLDLPDDYPIELVEGEKDEICSRCIIRKDKHCIVRFPEGNPDYDNVRGDGDHLNEFLRLAQALELNDQLAITTSLTHFSDSPPEETRVLKTNAAVVKTVLNSWI